MCGHKTNQSLLALVLNLLGRAHTRREPSLKGFLHLDRTGHEAMRLVGAATKKTYAPTDKTARELTMGITGTEQYRWYWRLGEPNSSLWKLNIVLRV